MRFALSRVARGGGQRFRGANAVPRARRSRDWRPVRRSGEMRRAV